MSESKTKSSFTLTDDPFPDREHEDFYKWVGVCIKEWTNIEKALFYFCSFVLKSETKHVAIIYYRTPSLEGRLSLTDDLIRSLFPKKPGEHDHSILVTWAEILSDIRSLVPIRNALAHWPVRYKRSIQARATDSGVAEIISEQTWMEIATSANERLKKGTEQSYRFDDLIKHRTDVRALWDRMEALSKALEQTLPSKSSPKNT
jgi:hypothetical protein